MFSSKATRGPGDHYTATVTNGRIVVAGSLGGGVGQSTTLVAAGVAVVEDIINARAGTGNLLVPSSIESNFANWKYPSTVAILRAGRAIVLREAATVGGQTAIGDMSGLITALGGDTVANLVAGTLLTISVANDLTRGSFVPATTGDSVYGRSIAAPAASGAVNPQEMTIEFWGFGGQVGIAA